MKKPKILEKLEDLDNKRVSYYYNANNYYGYKDVEIFITENNEILLFYPIVSYDEAELEFLDADDVEEMIIKYEKFRELLLNQEVVDNEYVDGLLEMQNKKKQLEMEQEQQRKLKAYNKLKEELGL